MNRVQRQSIVTLFFLSLLGFTNHIIHDYHQKRISNGILFILYISQDLFLNRDIMRLDMIIHHLLSICAGMYLLKNRDIVDRWEDVERVFSTEISTIFFALRGIGLRSNVNDALFFVTFFYYRIWRLYPLMYKDLPFFVYGLYVLNLYWFSKIIKKLLYQSNMIEKIV